MSNTYVELDGLRAYGTTAADVASQIAGAGAFDLAKNIAALTPVFGIIGADFLATYAVAQANHAKSVSELAAHYTATAVAATVTAANYEFVDASSGGAIQAAADAGTDA